MARIIHHKARNIVGGIRVKPTAKSFVIPETRTQEHWLALSNLDRVVNPTFSSAISFYPHAVGSHRTFKDIARSLKSSLSKVLVPFYPLAGRLELQSDQDGKVDLHCNDAGAVFVEASVDATLALLGGPQPFPALSGLEVARVGPGPRYIPDQLSGMPVLIVQVTVFRCGTVALATNWHHTVADGSSGVHFLRSWAEVEMGLDISVKPNHDRSVIRARNPPDHSLVKQYGSSVTGSSSDPSSNSDAAAAAKARPAVIAPDTILKVFRLDKEVAQELKRSVQSDDDSGGCSEPKDEKVQRSGFSTVEAVSAHLWQTMTRARAEEARSDSEAEDAGSTGRSTVVQKDVTKFFMFVDGRRRLGLPVGYFGNVVCSACALSSEEDILRRPLSYAAGLIKEAVRSTTDEYFRSLIDWVEVQGLGPAKSEHVNSVGHDVAATFWTLFPLYDLDFGWGKPTFATRNSPPRPLIDGIAMMPAPQGPGSMVAILNLQSDRMSRLQDDPAFCSVYSF